MDNINNSTLTMTILTFSTTNIPIEIIAEILSYHIDIAKYILLKNKKLISLLSYYFRLRIIEISKENSFKQNIAYNQEDMENMKNNTEINYNHELIGKDDINYNYEIIETKKNIVYLAKNYPLCVINYDIDLKIYDKESIDRLYFIYDEDDDEYIRNKFKIKRTDDSCNNKTIENRNLVFFNNVVPQVNTKICNINVLKLSESDKNIENKSTQSKPKKDTIIGNKNLVFFNDFVTQVNMKSFDINVLKSYKNAFNIYIYICNDKIEKNMPIIFENCSINNLVIISSKFEYIPLLNMLVIPNYISFFQYLSKTNIEKITSLDCSRYCNGFNIEIFVNLESLRLEGTIIGSSLKKLKKLKKLEIMGRYIIDDKFICSRNIFDYSNISHVAKTLTHLTITFDENEKVSFDFLKTLINVIELKINYGLSFGLQLSYMTKLRRLSISSCSKFDESVFKYLPNLEVLEIDYIKNFTGKTINMEKLKYLSIEFCINFDESVFKYLPALEKLEILKVENFTGKTLKYLKNIKSLNISNCINFEELNLEKLPNLEMLKLRNVKFTGKYLKYLVGIKSIIIHECRKTIPLEYYRYRYYQTNCNFNKFRDLKIIKKLDEEDYIIINEMKIIYAEIKAVLFGLKYFEFILDLGDVCDYLRFC